jgi:hypothetical protein
MNFFDAIWAWVMARWAERSTWDGTVIIALGVIVLVFQGLLPYAAWGAIAYGAWTFLKSEGKLPGDDTPPEDDA